MTTFKYLSFFLLWTATSTALCQNHSYKTNAKNNHVRSLTRQHIHDSLPKPSGYLNDFEYLFTESERTTIDSLLLDFANRTSIQVAVVTIATSMTTNDSLDAFTLKIANSWGVGQKGKNNGVLVGISRAYRKIRIQNGYGIEKILTDLETKEIIETDFIPSFRDAEYFHGTLIGLKSLMTILEERYK